MERFGNAASLSWWTASWFGFWAFLGLLEVLLANSYENVGNGSLPPRLTPIIWHCSQCRDIVVILVQVLLSHILGTAAEPSALKEQEQRRFCPRAARLLSEFTHSPEFLSPFHFHSHQKA